jgi:hypothetical protein
MRAGHGCHFIFRGVTRIGQGGFANPPYPNSNPARGDLTMPSPSFV